jgi:hypothetical protein
MNSCERWYEHRLCSRHSTSHTAQAAGAVEGAECFNCRRLQWNCSNCLHRLVGWDLNACIFKKRTVFQ